MHKPSPSQPTVLGYLPLPILIVSVTLSMTVTNGLEMANNPNVKKIDIKDMNPYQISSLKQQLDNEIGLLESSIIDLHNAKTKFVGCTETCEGFKSIENGSQIMVPLTSSLYVPGKVVNNNAFLLDIGTGYYVEKDLKSTTDYFNRKVKFLNEQIEKFAKMMQEKASIRQSIAEVLQQKQAALLSQQQQQQQQAQKS